MISPSANREVLHRGFPRAMDEDDILRIVDDFARAAQRCKDGGLDGLEVIASAIDRSVLVACHQPASIIMAGLWTIGCVLDGWSLPPCVKELVMISPLGYATMTEHDHDQSGLSEEDNMMIAQKLKDDGVIDFLNLVSGKIDACHD